MPPLSRAYESFIYHASWACLVAVTAVLARLHGHARRMGWVLP